MNERFRRVLDEALTRGAELELATPTVSAGIDGRRLGRRTGNALEFAEYREYQAGDDLRRLDWGVFARSEQLMVKLYSEEVDPRCDIVLDHSASMGTGEGHKAAAGFGIAALLSCAAVNAGFSLALWHAGEKLVREQNPARPGEWLETGFDSPSNPDGVLAASPGLFQNRGLRIAVTDLLWPSDPEGFLRRLSDGAMRVVLVELLDRSELEPEGNGNYSFCDPETGEERELMLDETMIRRYRERLARHREMWARAADEFGAGLIRLNAGDFLADWNLQDFFRCGVLK
jgi:uncharacterized protein (DUF58 family)